MCLTFIGCFQHYKYTDKSRIYKLLAKKIIEKNQVFLLGFVGTDQGAGGSSGGTEASHFTGGGRWLVGRHGGTPLHGGQPYPRGHIRPKRAPRRHATP